jgi:hypothetical protein
MNRVSESKFQHASPKSSTGLLMHRPHSFKTASLNFGKNPDTAKAHKTLAKGQKKEGGVRRYKNLSSALDVDVAL